MRNRNSLTVAVVTMLCIVGGIRTGVAARPVDRVQGFELKHAIPFEVGDVQLRKGDNITINEVRGTAATVCAGNIYVIKGTYRLTSEESASLSAYTTGNAADPKAMSMQSIPTQKTQTVDIDAGSGRFSLILYMWYDGNPHVSFYHDGQSIGGVYFGTGASVMQPQSAKTRNAGGEGKTSQSAVGLLRSRLDASRSQIEAASVRSNVAL